MSEEPKKDMQSYLSNIAAALDYTTKYNLAKTRKAIEILYSDGQKWIDEYEKGLLNPADAVIEIGCLSYYAKDVISEGEENCNPDSVYGYLTA
ncbi:MAG: hypothetical protein KTR28_05320 [Micavibrio sp.]|nr:hypothetical protein [Micavibrio sp.]